MHDEPPEHGDGVKRIAAAIDPTDAQTLRAQRGVRTSCKRCDQEAREKRRTLLHGPTSQWYTSPSLTDHTNPLHVHRPLGDLSTLWTRRLVYGIDEIGRASCRERVCQDV